MIASLPISRKLWLLLLPFTLAVLVLAGMLIADKAATLRHAESSREMIRLAGSAGQLIHDLQVERGLTNGFLTGSGALPPALVEARGGVDKSWQAFQAQTALFTGTAFAGDLAESSGKLTALLKEREAINGRSIAPAQAVKAYSGGIESLTQAIARLAKSDIDNGLLRKTVALLNILCEKEFAGRERAYVNGLLTAAVTPVNLAEHKRLLGWQEACAGQLALMASDTVRQQAAEIAASQETQALQSLRKSWQEDPAQAANWASGQWFQVATQRIVLLKRVHDQLLDGMYQDADALVAGAKTYLLTLVAVLAVLTVLLLWLARTIATSMLRQIGGELSDAIVVAQRVADGNLDVAIPLRAGDQHSLMAAMERMRRQLHQTVCSIQLTAGQVGESSQGVSASSEQIACGAIAQSEAASAMAAAVEQMTQSLANLSENASEARSVSENSGRIAREGGEIIGRAVHGMKDLLVVAEAASQPILALAEQSNRISSIVQVIKEVADQTNLLALNAAIEAARAGEQGRGFAVVADEVRKLAERTSQSTAEISTMIDCIQDSTKEAVARVDSIVQSVVSDQDLAHQAGQRIEEIQNGAIRVVAAVNAIAQSLHEQSAASQEVSRNVEQVAQMTEENSAAAGQTAVAAQQLHAIAQDMQAAVSSFKV